MTDRTVKINHIHTNYTHTYPETLDNRNVAVRFVGAIRFEFSRSICKLALLFNADIDLITDYIIKKKTNRI